MEKIRILYAEDYDLVLFTAKQLLEAEGWEVEVCRDGASALRKLEGSEHFDLLILDERLPGASGAEMIERARRNVRLRATPVVMFTSQQGNGAAAPPRADAYLSKPGGLKALVATCRSLLPKAAQPTGPDEAAAGPVGPAD